MSTIKEFEDLRCWQMARALTARIYKMTKVGELSRDFDTRSQLRSASLSIMNNISEGFGRFSNKDSIRFYDYAVASVSEVKSMSYLMLDLEYFDDKVISEIQGDLNKIRASVLALIKYLRNNESRG